MNKKQLAARKAYNKAEARLEDVGNSYDFARGRRNEKADAYLVSLGWHTMRVRGPGQYRFGRDFYRTPGNYSGPHYTLLDAVKEQGRRDRAAARRAAKEIK